MKRVLVFDVETTGLLLPSTADLADQPHIIEVGIVEIVSLSGTEGKLALHERSWLINPGVPITDEITKITGLSDKDLVGKPAFGDVLPELIEIFLGAQGMVAHNIPFDLGMLVTELKRLGREHRFPYPPEQLCTVTAYAHVKGHNLKLPDLYKHVIGTELKQTHRALDDARALAEIVIKDGAA